MSSLTRHPARHDFLFRIHTRLRSPGQSFDQLQIASSGFVVSEVGQLSFLYLATARDRYRIDRSRHRLHPMRIRGEGERIGKLRQMLGEITVERAEEAAEIDGFLCRRVCAFTTKSPLILSVEAWCARIPGLSVTALGEERRYDARHQPFALPLDPDEVVVRSTTRVQGAGPAHVQHTLLCSVEPLEGLAPRYLLPLTFEIAESP